ncbi:MAG: SCO family protein [Taibaiella sp.]|nr:SCO family protein [Taibaiella sp.]
MSKKTNNSFIMGLAVAFLLPLSFYMIARMLSKDSINLPDYYGVERVDSTMKDGKLETDTVYHTVADLQLTNQLGDQVSLNKDLASRIMVVDFFFVACPSVCPRLAGNIGMLQKAFRRNTKNEFGIDKSVHFVSISVDPAHDTFQALRAYADRFGANHDHWWFLTGDKQSIYDYARNELKLAVGPGDGGAEDFIHTEKLVLIDAQRKIRGYYDGLDTVEIKRCADDMVLLTMEKVKKRK